MRDVTLEQLHEQIGTEDSPQSALVLADLLMQRGDIRGELIIAQHEGDTARANSLIEEHWRELIGVVPGQEIELTWRLGFLREARVNSHVYKYSQQYLVDLVHALLVHPGNRHLRAISLVENQRGGQLRELLSALAREGIRAPVSLQSLSLGSWYARERQPWTTRDSARYYDGLEALWSVFPHIESLSIDVGAASLSFGAIEAPSLRRFEWIQPQMTKDVLGTLCGARWPRLEALRLWLGAHQIVNNYGGEDFDEHDDYEDEPLYNPTGEDITSEQDLEPLLSHLDTLPHLEMLGLVNYTGPWAPLLAAIAEHPFAKQLRTLDLSGGQLAEDDIDSFVALCKSLPRLESVNGSALRTSSEGLQALAVGLGEEIRFSGEAAYGSAPHYLYIESME